MRYLALYLIFILSACATKSREPAMVAAPAGALELSQALQQGQSTTLTYLRAQATVKPYGDLSQTDPMGTLPESLHAEKPVITAADKNEKIEQQKYLRKFRRWTLEKKVNQATALTTDFECSKAVESQALGMSLELDFPDAKARELSQSLHKQVLSCSLAGKNESLFRLTVFSIQNGECSKAQDYLKMFPTKVERGVSDRIAYLRSLCSSSSAEVAERNPWGGYGILLADAKKSSNHPTWFLSAKSGSEEWDRLLMTFVDLTEKSQAGTVKYIASKLNFEKFRQLPLPFQTSMLVLMSFNAADLPVFQTLHRYLSDHPEMLSPAVAGLLFPVRYWKEIVDNSKNTDPILVKALIRQESAFNPAAKSRAKAAGLMQLIYPTARIFGVTKPKQLLTPRMNIHAGSEFLARLINEFGSVELALAAYNAGPQMVRDWQKRYPTNNVDLFVEMIPYTETREYVRLVNRNYRVYQSILVKPQVVSGF